MKSYINADEDYVSSVCFFYSCVVNLMQDEGDLDIGLVPTMVSEYVCWIGGENSCVDRSFINVRAERSSRICQQIP